METMSISGQESLVKAFEKARGGSFVAFEYLKNLASNKDHKNDCVQVVQEYANVYVGGDYATKVANKLAQNGLPTDYQVSPTWGEHINQILVENNGKKYFECYFINGYTCKETYLLNGEPTTKEQIAEYVRPSELVKKSSLCEKQAAAGLDEENQVKPRKLPIDKLIGMRFNGVAYV